MTEMGLAARAHDKILRTARTIADLDNCDVMKPYDLNEAINYRMLDGNMWTSLREEVGFLRQPAASAIIQL